MCRTSYRKGLTLIECVTTIALVGLLCSLLLPAVEQARESARRAACTNHLRQLGVAVHSYASRHECFPSVTGAGDARRMPRFYSAFAQVLADLDQRSLFDAINFDVGLGNPLDRPRWPVPGAGANATSLATSVGLFLCPSDPAPIDPRYGGMSYRANLGAERWYEQGDATAGPFSTSRHPSGPASVTDGLGNTALASEKLRGRFDSPDVDPRTDLLFCGRGLPLTAEEAYQDCAARATADRGRSPRVGMSWLIGTLAHTGYNHIQAPNSPVPDCASPTEPIVGLAGARSNHPDGVAVAFADGSVRFVRSSVSRPIWTAIGTRSGLEVVSAGTY